MDIDRELSPPANNKIVPDVYNVLDAHLVKKTTTINNMLQYRLDSQEKVISKHRRDAERYLVHEKARAVDSLNRIHTKLNAVNKIRDFDLKFFNQRSLETDSKRKQKQKGYQRDKNEDAICHRCYIHHLPLKKRFYQKDDDSPLNNKHGHQNFLASKLKPAHKDLDNRGSTDDQTDTPEPERDASILRVRRLSSPSLNRSRRGSLAPTMGAFGWWMPTPPNQQFLWKDKSGREVDVNKGCTPRLATNEEWKNVVKNVCSLYSKRRRGRDDLNQTL